MHDRLKSGDYGLSVDIEGIFVEILHTIRIKT